VLFTGRLTVSLLGMGMSEDAAASITPAVLRDLDGTTRAAVVGAYQHALAPVLPWRLWAVRRGYILHVTPDLAARLPTTWLSYFAKCGVSPIARPVSGR